MARFYPSSSNIKTSTLINVFTLPTNVTTDGALLAQVNVSGSQKIVVTSARSTQNVNVLFDNRIIWQSTTIFQDPNSSTSGTTNVFVGGWGESLIVNQSGTTAQTAQLWTYSIIERD